MHEERSIADVFIETVEIVETKNASLSSFDSVYFAFKSLMTMITFTSGEIS